MLIDFHTHAYPDKLAERTVKRLGEEGNVEYFTDGTVCDLEKRMTDESVDFFVLQHIAVTPKHEKNVNIFALQTNVGNKFSFGSVHPYSETWEQSLNELKKSGIKGVKFHNEYQNFYVDDKKAYSVYETCEKLGLIMMFHGGADIAFKPPYKCSPESFARVAKTFPRANFVFAHLGGLHTQKESVTHLAPLKNVYTDTAFSSQNYTASQGREIVNAFGAGRVLFGSDCPWDTPRRTVEYIKTLKLDKVDEEKIFSENARGLLDI